MYSPLRIDSRNTLIKFHRSTSFESLSAFKCTISAVDFTGFLKSV